MTQKEFNGIAREFIADFLKSDKERFEDEDEMSLYDIVVEEILNDAIMDGVQEAVASWEKPDYCDKHEEIWKIQGKWRA